MAARKQNLWPFTRKTAGPVKTARRSSLTVGEDTRAAFKAGQQSGDTGLFDSWLRSKGLEGRGNVLRARLSKEYERGVIQGEKKSPDDLNREFVKRSSTARPVRYKGRSIEPSGEEWIIPSIDRESRFDSLADAKRFLDSWGRANPITDRAHRYRANNLMPEGAKVCTWCGSKRNVVPDHIDGFPDHTTPGNLQWLCKSCNTKKGAAFAKLGKGRLTKQYNPAEGVPTFEQYAWAVSQHMPGAHDEGGVIIHATPTNLRSEYARRIAGIKRQRGTDSRGGDMPDWVTNPSAENPLSLPDQAVYFGGKRYWRRVYSVARLPDGRLTGLVTFAGKAWRVYQVAENGHWDTIRVDPAASAEAAKRPNSIIWEPDNSASIRQAETSRSVEELARLHGHALKAKDSELLAAVETRAQQLGISHEALVAAHPRQWANPRPSHVPRNYEVVSIRSTGPDASDVFHALEGAGIHSIVTEQRYSSTGAPIGSPYAVWTPKKTYKRAVKLAEDAYFARHPERLAQNPGSYVVRGRRYSSAVAAIDAAEAIAKSEGRNVMVSDASGELHTVYPTGEVGQAWQHSRESTRLPNPAGPFPGSGSIEGVNFQTGNDGVVFWCDDWEKLIEWAQTGQHGFRLRAGGPETYGHTDVVRNPNYNYPPTRWPKGYATKKEAQEAWYDSSPGRNDKGQYRKEGGLWYIYEGRGELPKALANPASLSDSPEMQVRFRQAAMPRGGYQSAWSPWMYYADIPTVNGRIRELQETADLRRVSFSWEVQRKGPGGGWQHHEHDKGKVKPHPKGTRRNPASSSAALYESFHGKPATEEIVIQEEVHEHENLAVLGRLVECFIETPTGLLAHLEFDEDEGAVMCCSSEDGKQLYFEDGDQTVDLTALKMDGPEWVKDRMVLGQFAQPEAASKGKDRRKHNLTYHTRKDFDGMEPIDYQHDLGEESGVRPYLEFDTRNQRLYVSGGQYHIEQPLFETSPGIEN